jgi:hypothetical protein
MLAARFQIEKVKTHTNRRKVLKQRGFGPVLIEPPHPILRWTHHPFPPKLFNNGLGEKGDGAQNQFLSNKNGAGKISKKLEGGRPPKRSMGNRRPGNRRNFLCRRSFRCGSGPARSQRPSLLPRRVAQSPPRSDGTRRHGRSQARIRKRRTANQIKILHWKFRNRPAAQVAARAPGSTASRAREINQSSLGKSPRSGRNMLSSAHANTNTDDVALDFRRSFHLHASLA